LSFIDVLALSFLAVGTQYWLAVLVATLLMIRRVRPLDAAEPGGVETLPRVSVVLLVHGNERDLEGPVKKRLEDGRPDIEIVLVTAARDPRILEAVERIRSLDRRVKSVLVDAVPPAWLARPYLMKKGLEESRGEWILFSDAEAEVEPGTLAGAIGYCLKEKVDFLSLVPELRKTNSFLDSVLQVFLRIMLLSERAWLANSDASTAAVGISSFMLVRRDLLQRTAALDKVALEPSEDAALAQVLKKEGGRCRLLNGRGRLKSYYAHTLKEAVNDSMAGVYASLGDCSPSRILIMGLLFMLVELGPYFFFLPIGIRYHEWIGTAAVTIGIVVSVIVCRWIGLSLAAAFYFPVDLLIVIYILFRSGIMGAIQGGIHEDGRFYPSSMLRKGRKFRMA
jgi:hypothetical protein